MSGKNLLLACRQDDEKSGIRHQSVPRAVFQNSPLLLFHKNWKCAPNDAPSNGFYVFSSQTWETVLQLPLTPLCRKGLQAHFFASWKDAKSLGGGERIAKTFSPFHPWPEGDWELRTKWSLLQNVCRNLIISHSCSRGKSQEFWGTKLPLMRWRHSVLVTMQGNSGPIGTSSLL